MEQGLGAIICQTSRRPCRPAVYSCTVLITGTYHLNIASWALCETVIRMSLIVSCLRALVYSFSLSRMYAIAGNHGVALYSSPVTIKVE